MNDYETAQISSFNQALRQGNITTAEYILNDLKASNCRHVKTLQATLQEHKFEKALQSNNFVEAQKAIDAIKSVGDNNLANKLQSELSCFREVIGLSGSTAGPERAFKEALDENNWERAKSIIKELKNTGCNSVAQSFEQELNDVQKALSISAEEIKKMQQLGNKIKQEAKKQILIGELQGALRKRQERLTALLNQIKNEPPVEEKKRAEEFRQSAIADLDNLLGDLEKAKGLPKAEEIVRKTKEVRKTIQQGPDVKSSIAQARETLDSLLKQLVSEAEVEKVKGEQELNQALNQLDAMVSQANKRATLSQDQRRSIASVRDSVGTVNDLLIELRRKNLAAEKQKLEEQLLKMQQEMDKLNK